MNSFPRLIQQMRFLPVLCMVLVAACTEPRNAQDLVSEAEAHAALHRYDLAISSLEAAIQLDPSDPELRLVMAELYLGAERGDLAGATLKQALDRGLEAWRAAGPGARALLLQGKYYEILSQDISGNLPPLVELELRYLKAKALLAVSHPAKSNPEITRSYLQLIPMSKQFTGTAIASEIVADFEALRREWPDIDRAWQHLNCGTSAAEIFQWAPVARPGARILRVGPSRELKSPADAATVAQDGDVVEIDPGDYIGGVAYWPQNQLVVRGAHGRPSIEANGKAIRKRDVWLFTGDDVVIENVEISGARSPYQNGAGIRHTGSGLKIRHVFLHDNENGVLTGNRRPESEILIEYSELGNNGDGKGYAHNAYIGKSRKLIFRFNYSHEARGGHLLKSRAHENVVTYNRLADEESGSSSYIVDIPEGGIATVTGNMIQQGYGTLNHAMISFAAEAISHDQNELSVASNTVYNRDLGGIFVRNHADASARLINNLFAGAEVTSAVGSGYSIANLSHPEHGLRDWKEGDFSLIEGALAIDMGSDEDPAPAAEYVHPVSGRVRQQVWRRDVGAFERCGL